MSGIPKWSKHPRYGLPLRCCTNQMDMPVSGPQFIGPLAYPGMIFMDLSFDEPLCLAPERRTILTEPFLSEGQKVLAYPLEELLAEKIRSLMERGKSRDYYECLGGFLRKNFPN